MSAELSHLGLVGRVALSVYVAVVSAAALVHAEPSIGPTLPFEIQSARGTEGLVFETTASQTAPTRWQRAIYIVTTSEVKQSTAELRIAGCVLATDTGAFAMVAPIALPPQDLLPGSSIAVSLKATFPRTGIYKGELSLVQQSRLRVVPIRVTVSAPPLLPIKAHGGGAVSLTGDELATWSLEIGNTSTEPLMLAAPIVAIARLDQADNPKTRFKVSVVMSTPSMVWQSIAPRTVGHITLVTGAIDEPGIYEVETLVLDESGAYTPSSLVTIVYRRRSWWWAAVMIALGALLAAGVRWYFEGGKPRMDLRARIARLQQRIRLASDQVRSDALMAATKMLAIDVEDLRRTLWRPYWTLADQEARLGRADRRLQLLLQIQDVAVLIDRLEPARQPALRKELDAAVATVRDDLGDSAIAKQRDAVASLAARGVWRDQLAGWLDELDAQRKRQLPGAAAQLSRDLAKLGDTFAEIRELLTLDQLSVAHTRLEALQMQLTQIVTTELQQLTSTNNPPLGVDASAWKEASTLIQDLLGTAGDSSRSQAERKTAFADAQQRYIHLLVRGLAREAERKAESQLMVGTDQALLSEEVERLREISRELRGAVERDPAEAASRYSAVREEVEQAGLSRYRNTPISATGDRLRTRILRWFLPRNDVQPPPTETLPEAPRVPRIATTTRWAVNVVVLALAVASGIRALWIDDLSWNAWLAAFLWGAGVQAAGSAVVDVGALRAKLKGTAAP